MDKGGWNLYRPEWVFGLYSNAVKVVCAEGRRRTEYLKDKVVIVVCCVLHVIIVAINVWD